MSNYFSHDSNARNSDKLIPLRIKMGAEGYGIYFMLLERLREEPDYTSVKDYNMLAFDLRVDAAQVKAVVETFGLFSFTEDGERFYSEGFLARMKHKDEKSEKARESANKRWESMRTHNDEDANAMRTHKKSDAIKEKKSKVKNIINNPPISPLGETESEKKESLNSFHTKNPPPAEENQKSCGKKGNNLDFVSAEFLPLVERWLRYKADKKQSYRSEDSVRAMYDKLIRYSGGNLTTATEIIEDAMANNYNGFFELKKDGNNERKSNVDTRKTIVPNTVAKRESTI